MCPLVLRARVSIRINVNKQVKINKRSELISNTLFVVVTRESYNTLLVLAVVVVGVGPLQHTRRILPCGPTPTHVCSVPCRVSLPSACSYVYIVYTYHTQALVFAAIYASYHVTVPAPPPPPPPSACASAPLAHCANPRASGHSQPYRRAVVRCRAANTIAMLLNRCAL